MSTIRDYMNRVRKVEETLPECESSFWLVSLANEPNKHVGGRIVNVNRSNAARLILDGLYRLATDEEAAAKEAADEQAREQARHAKLSPTVRYRGECIVLQPATDEAQPEKKGRR